MWGFHTCAADCILKQNCITDYSKKVVQTCHILQEMLQFPPTHPPSRMPRSKYTDFEIHSEVLKWIIHCAFTAYHTTLLLLHCVTALAEWYEDFYHTIIIHLAYQHED
jgi:hypothetical protein